MNKTKVEFFKKIIKTDKRLVRLNVENKERKLKSLRNEKASLLTLQK